MIPRSHQIIGQRIVWKGLETLAGQIVGVVQGSSGRVFLQIVYDDLPFGTYQYDSARIELYLSEEGEYCEL